jgi:hypothetical protein
MDASWPTSTAHSVHPLSPRSWTLCPPTSSVVSPVLPPPWSANILLSLCLHRLVTLTLFVKALPLHADFPPRQPSPPRLLVGTEVAVSF